MTPPTFTDEQLALMVQNPATTLEAQLAQVVLDDRAVFRMLCDELRELVPMLDFAPHADTLTRQLHAIESRLP